MHHLILTLRNELIPRSGNYKKLLSYQKADSIFQITYFFSKHFLSKRDRTVDQMIQAARSGKQNIIEGCNAFPTSSKKTEIKLINVAKASLKELLEDYEDYLETRGLRQWEVESIEYEAIRKLGSKHNEADLYMKLIATRTLETIVNIAIILINNIRSPPSLYEYLPNTYNL